MLAIVVAFSCSAGYDQHISLSDVCSVVIGLLGTGEAYGSGDDREDSWKSAFAQASTVQMARCATAHGASALNEQLACGNYGPCAKSCCIMKADAGAGEQMIVSTGSSDRETPADARSSASDVAFDSDFASTTDASSESHEVPLPTAGNLPPAPSAILKSVITSVLYQNEPSSIVEMRQWLVEAEALQLPSNPLDEIMSFLAAKGVPSVELSGRHEVAGQRNNARDRFQSGEVHVAVISDAASTGVSLHAPQPIHRDSRGRCAVRPRLHVTLELNWSADRQIQQLGRTHRTGQACPPEHVLLVTDVCGEKRFVSTVARRLRSLGALSGDGGGIADGKWHEVLQSYETEQGSEALMHMYSALGFALAVPIGIETDANADLHSPTRAAASLRAYLRYRVPTLPKPDSAAEQQTTAAGLMSEKRKRDSHGSCGRTAVATTRLSAAGNTTTREDGRESEDDEDMRDDDDHDAPREFFDADWELADAAGLAYSTSSGPFAFQGTEPKPFRAACGSGEDDLLDRCSGISCPISARDAKVQRARLLAALQRAGEHLLPDATMRPAATAHSQVCKSRGITSPMVSALISDTVGRRNEGCKIAREAVPEQQVSSSTSGCGAPMLRSKAASVTLFLNRLLGLALGDQSLLLHFFNFLLSRAVRRAHRDGILDRGVEIMCSPMLIASAVLLPEVRSLPRDGKSPLMCASSIPASSPETSSTAAAQQGSSTLASPSQPSLGASPSILLRGGSGAGGGSTWLPTSSISSVGAATGKESISRADGKLKCLSSQASPHPVGDNTSAPLLLLKLIPCAMNATTINFVSSPELPCSAQLSLLGDATSRAAEVQMAGAVRAEVSSQHRGNFYKLKDHKAGDQRRTVDGSADAAEVESVLPPIVFAVPASLPNSDEGAAVSSGGMMSVGDVKAGSLKVMGPIGGPLPYLNSQSALASYGYTQLEDHERAVGMWHACVATTACPEKECFLLCGPVHPYLPRLQRTTSGLPRVLRVTLISGQVAVGLVVPREQIASMFHSYGRFNLEAPRRSPTEIGRGMATSAAASHAACGRNVDLLDGGQRGSLFSFNGNDPGVTVGSSHRDCPHLGGAVSGTSGGSQEDDNEIGGLDIDGGEVHSRWMQHVEDAFRSQRRLQQLLPSSGDDERKGWQECWTTIKEHETLDLEPDEMIERKVRAEEVKEFALQVQRSKRARETVARRSVSHGRSDVLGVLRGLPNATSAETSEPGASTGGGMDLMMLAESTVRPDLSELTSPIHLMPSASSDAANSAQNTCLHLGSCASTSAASPTSSLAASGTSSPTFVNASANFAEATRGISSSGVSKAFPAGCCESFFSSGSIHEVRSPPVMSKACRPGSFMPAFRAARAPAAMQRAAAQDALHPLLQVTTTRTPKP